jgi:hypothetical protein
LDVAEEGVMFKESPVTSTKTPPPVVVENVSVLVVLTTCNTLPAGKPAVVALVSIVPVSLGSESVKFEFVLGALMVSVPEPLTFPSREIFDKILLLY